jgi:hypothetical protein
VELDGVEFRAEEWARWVEGEIPSPERNRCAPPLPLLIPVLASAASFAEVTARKHFSRLPDGLSVLPPHDPGSAAGDG